jgi:hypothetical protein
VLVSPRRRHSGPLRHVDSDDDTGIVPPEFRLEATTETRLSPSGEKEHGRGYLICDPHTGTPLREDDFFFRISGGVLTDVVALEEHIAELQDPAFSAGRVLALVQHPPRTAGGPPVISVRDPTISLQAGELPEDVAETIAAYGDGYEAAFCLWEWRSDSGARLGIRLLLAPGWNVQALPG